MNQKSRLVIGVDEAGRGCLAGPVYAAAVILPEPYPEWVANVRDSKKISAGKREKLAEKIEKECIYSVFAVDAEHIDGMNILNATLWAMKLAVEDIYRNFLIQIGPDAVILVDGNKTIPAESDVPGWLMVPWEQRAIPDGDNLHKSIGAASILAKVHRDRYMTDFADKQYPDYGFSIHKGYGTKVHREAIKTFGPTPLHRKTFSGVYQYVKGAHYDG